MSNKILIFLLFVVLFEEYFGNVSPKSYYGESIENDNNEENIKEEVICKPSERNECTCKCTREQKYDCNDCTVSQEQSTNSCIPGEIIDFYCPLCTCDENGFHICDNCFQRRYMNEKNKNNVYRKKRDADSFYDYLYEEPLPLSTEQRRELQRQTYLQRRQDLIDRRREKQELAEQQAELARQNAEMRKELEYQRRLDEEQRALDAQQDYVDVYIDEENNEQDNYFTKKRSDKKIRF